MRTKPFVIGIAGGSGSGKTFFLNSFLNHFSKEEVCLVSQDDYYHPVGKMSQEENRLYNFDLPSTIDDQQFLADVKSLLTGNVIYKKEYTFNNPGAVPKMLEVKPAPVLIIEGLFILHFREIAGLIDLSLFIETDENVALQRRLKRDFVERGYFEEDVMYKWVNHVLPAYNEFLLPYRSGCHRVIINNIEDEHTISAIANDISDELRKTVLEKN